MNLPTDIIADKLTMAGLEVEVIEEKESDEILSIKVPSNRSDCLSIIGIARELKAILDLKKDVKLALQIIEDQKDDIKNLVEVKIEAPNLCRRYCARIIKGVKVHPSPLYLQDKLQKLGIRPINNIVDATNYICLLLGQPLHAFDYELIEGKKIIVRCAQENERIITLDGVERNLTNDMLVIADDKKPIAIAGVIGGKETEININTTTVLLESANFSAQSIRKTAKELNITTESSYRFERNIDPNNVRYAIDAVAKLIIDIAGGKLVEGIIDVYPDKLQESTINFRPSRCNYILGKNIEEYEMINIFNRLNFRIVKDNDILEVTIPTYRADIKKEIDLIEEVARIYGYDNFEETYPICRITPGKQSNELFLKDKIREIFVSLGFNEVITHSLIDEAIFDKIYDNKQYAIYLKNPMLKNYALLRTSILPNLLEVVANNIRRGVGECIKIFEVGKVYQENNKEINCISCLVTDTLSKNKFDIEEEINFYYLKGILNSLLERLGIENHSIMSSEKTLFENNSCCKIILDNNEIGYLGEIKKTILTNFDIKVATYGFELNLDNMKEFINLKKEYKKVSKFPSVRRDIAIVVKEDIPNAMIKNVIRKTDIKELIYFECFDVYKGDKIEKRHKSLAYTLIFNSPERTLRKEEVDEYVRRIVELLNFEVNAKIREK